MDLIDVGDAFERLRAENRKLYPLNPTLDAVTLFFTTAPDLEWGYGNYEEEPEMFTKTDFLVRAKVQLTEATANLRAAIEQELVDGVIKGTTKSEVAPIAGKLEGVMSETVLLIEKLSSKPAAAISSSSCNDRY